MYVWYDTKRMNPTISYQSYESDPFAWYNLTSVRLSKTMIEEKLKSKTKIEETKNDAWLAL